jgi:prepilin-type N-terminal cleavage/methylation domain-containing protein
MDMKINQSTTPQNEGFSLFEMLTVVCILGIMIAMAIPAFGNSHAARQAKDQRNAQGFCSLAMAASAAGIQIAQGTQDPKVALQRLVEGVTVTKGPLKGRLFILPHVTTEDVAGASQFVRIVNGELQYANVESTM